MPPLVVLSAKNISIHALREEGDESFIDLRHEVLLFLSTPSARRATIHLCRSFHPCRISIHALREEGDVHMYSHVPTTFEFLSTPSARRATCLRFASNPYIGNFYPRPP